MLRTTIHTTIANAHQITIHVGMMSASVRSDFAFIEHLLRDEGHVLSDDAAS